MRVADCVRVARRLLDIGSLPISFQYRAKKVRGRTLATPVFIGSPTWARTRDLRINRQPVIEPQAIDLQSESPDVLPNILARASPSCGDSVRPVPAPFGEFASPRLRTSSLRAQAVRASSLALPQRAVAGGRLDHRVVARGHERGHEQHLAHVRSASKDGSFAAHRARVTIARGMRWRSSGSGLTSLRRSSRCSSVRPICASIVSVGRGRMRLLRGQSHS